MKKNSFYTYLDTVYADPENKKGFLYYVLYYKIELTAQFKQVKWSVNPMMISQPRVVPDTTMDPKHKFDYVLEGLRDEVPHQLCEIVLETDHVGGVTPPKLEGTIKIEIPSNGNKFIKRNRWEQIAVRILHDHPHKTHDGSSTAHLGDGD